MTELSFLHSFWSRVLIIPNQICAKTRRRARGIFDLAEHSRWFVAGKVYAVEMASSHSSSMNYAQERQLVLMETMNKRLDSILEGQKKLEEKNMNLQQENAKLKSQLERKTVQTRRRSTRSSPM